MKPVVSIVAIVLVLGLSVAGAMVLVRLRDKPERREPAAKPPLVETVTAQRGEHRVTVAATGVVLPDSEVAIVPQVSGLVVEKSAELLPGGRLTKGDVIARIDPRDYGFAVERADADVERARYELALEKGRQVVAKQEWGLLGKDMPTDEAARDLALRRPHLRNAEAALRAAESSLALARLNLERTTLRAPFNAIVREESIGVGQLATPQMTVARLIGTDAFRVRVTLPVEKIELIGVPGLNGCAEGEGSRVRIVQLADQSRRIEREGRIVRLLGDLEPRGRLARVLVIVEDPLGLKNGAALPLLVGAYVRAEIEGVVLKDVIPLPRTALREGDAVWIVTDSPEGRHLLKIKAGVVCRHTEKDRIFVCKGVETGERVIVNRVAVPSDGREVRLIGEAPKEAEKPMPPKGGPKPSRKADQ